MPDLHAIETRTPAASVIIPAKNEAKNIGACLGAIFSQEAVDNFEVIVIDSGSTDGTIDIISAFDVRLIQITPEEFGHGRTRNLGARMARSDVLVFLNADATPTGPRWLAGLLHELQPADVAGVYGRQVARDDAFPMERFFLDYWYGTKRRVQRMTGAHLDVDNVFFSTVNCAMKQPVWAAFPFDEIIVMTEDQVWSRQALLAGHTLIYAPALAVVHSHNYTLKQAFKRFFDAGWSADASFMPDQGGSAFALAKRSAMYLPLELAYLVRNGQFRWIPHAIAYDATKMLAVIAGRLHRFLPMRVKRAFSANYRAHASTGDSAG